MVTRTTEIEKQVDTLVHEAKVCRDVCWCDCMLTELACLTDFGALRQSWDVCGYDWSHGIEREEWNGGEGYNLFQLTLE